MQCWLISHVARFPVVAFCTSNIPAKFVEISNIKQCLVQDCPGKIVLVACSRGQLESFHIVHGKQGKIEYGMIRTHNQRWLLSAVDCDVQTYSHYEVFGQTCFPFDLIHPHTGLSHMIQFSYMLFLFIPVPSTQPNLICQHNCAKQTVGEKSKT